MLLQAQEYWNTVGSKKDFEDPFYLTRLSSFLTKESKIVEYGCGYGRLMQILYENGCHNLIGFDFSQSMTQRGKKLCPHLDLRLVEEVNKIPCENESVDAVIMSTVLCCIIDSNERRNVLEEVFRVLTNKGVFYLSDFLLCDEDKV